MSDVAEKPADAAAEVESWLARFNAALAAGDAAGAAELFAPDCHWRDIVAFTWNVKTVSGREAVRDMLFATLARIRPRGFALDGEAKRADGGIEAFVTFETGAGRGRGHLRLRDGAAFTLLTTLQELRGHEEPAGPRRPLGAVHAPVRGRKDWAARRAEEDAAWGETRQPYALIVGGGQGGIALAARLKRLGVPALIVERNARPGDSWRNRYRSLVLHDPVWYDHLPYLPFPDHWPVFAPKDKMGDWLEAYAQIMELDFWGSTECRGARREGEAWAVEVEREGRPVTLRPAQLILATGAYGPPRIPEIPGAESFAGALMHSSEYRSGEPFAGKRCVVIGSNTSAHDICVDLWEAGAAEVTMVQRSPTLVVRSETILDVGFRDLYSEHALANGIDTETADMLFAATPLALAAEAGKAPTREMARRDADLLDRLRAAGFRLTFGHDESGLMMMAFRTGSGYYIEVGGSELIARGDVKVRAGEPERFTAEGVTLSDGATLPADAVIWATGYQTMQATIAKLISPAAAERIGHCWGYGSGTPGDPGPWEGELRNLWKPTAEEGLWLHGGNLHLSRFFSKFLALQIKARMEGIPTPVYGAPSNAL